MDIESLYRDHNIDYVSDSGHRHARQGWVNTSCPFCTGNPGYHLGYDTHGKKFVCYRCGGHSAQNTISELLHVTYKEAKKLLKQYGAHIGRQHKMTHKIRTMSFKLPSNAEELQERHIKYLIKRKFDPDYLIKEFKLLGTGMMSKLKAKDDKILNYKHRIIIPFYWDNEIVSFDSRDITEKAINKYQACPLERELIEHKHILYGRQDKWNDTAVCLEGPTDVWRMGFNSFATSGIKYTPKQLRLIAKLFKRVPVIFDDEPQAIKQADKLVSDLKFRGVDAFRVDIQGDPGGLEQSEADYLMKQLI